MPTEVHPGGRFLPTFAEVPQDIDATARMDEGEVRRMIADARRAALEAAAASKSAGRAKPKGMPFIDDSETDLMNEELQAELAKLTQRPRRR